VIPFYLQFDFVSISDECVGEKGVGSVCAEESFSSGRGNPGDGAKALSTHGGQTGSARGSGPVRCVDTQDPQDIERDTGTAGEEATGNSRSEEQALSCARVSYSTDYTGTFDGRCPLTSRGDRGCPC
jgi:hypothetical protein